MEEKPKNSLKLKKFSIRIVFNGQVVLAISENIIKAGNMERFFAYIRTLIDQDTVWIPVVIISLLAFNFLIIVKRSVLRDILDILSDILSKGYHAVLSFLDNAMEAAKSASLFILSIRVMLFKQQSQRVTTHVLHSSIFFLSIASYIATFSSMKLMVNSTLSMSYSMKKTSLRCFWRGLPKTRKVKRLSII